MAATLSPQKSAAGGRPTPPPDAPQTGLRRWTSDEYRRIGDLGLFEGLRVELRGGGVWEVHSPRLYHWTPEQYHRLIEAGLFDGGRVELLGGLIWDMTGQLSLHATGVRLTQLALEDVFDGAFEVRIQMSIILPDGTEPEPDIAVAPGTPLDYLEHHPRAGEVLLAVEVSDSSPVKDRGRKLVAYAEASVEEYWIVNLGGRQLEVYRRPTPGGVYADFKTYQPGDSVAPLNRPDRPVVVADLLPPVKQN